ncbi:MAG: electron transport complex subunit RsxC [Filifactoraceae bacterium]
MSLLSFRGGIHPPHNKKTTENKPLENSSMPKIVYIPLSQHIGAPASPVVSPNDRVKVGQKIGEMSGFVSANVHSSVSGVVKEIITKTVPGGQKSAVIVIENDMTEEICESIKPYKSLEELSKEDIMNAIKEAGIVGMGGATFPTHVKLSPPKEKPIDIIVLNGAECEPYLTADHRLMLEQPEDIVYGLKAMMKLLDVKKGYIGIEDNKPDCISKMKEIVGDISEIQVVGLQTKYPQGAEKQLIYACSKREVPSGGLPMDVGVVVTNVATSSQIGKTLKTGMPLIDRICTITGSAIVDPKNLIIKMGTLYSELIDQCGGFNQQPGKIISGGPMMGIAQATTDVPAVKGSSGILCLTNDEIKDLESSNCIRCGKCISICPASIQPMNISAFSILYNYDKAEEFRALDCIECGSCSFVCPAKRPLLQSIRVAKQEILAKRRRNTK